MADFSADFMEYLKIYNPSAYDKVNSDNIKPEELTAIYNANVSKFEVWESIPEVIRNRYYGQPVPQEIMDAAARGEIYTLREMEYHPEIKRIDEARAKAAEEYGSTGNSSVSDDIVRSAVAVFIAARIAGYSVEACHELARNHQSREEMLKNKPDNMNKDEKSDWMKEWLAIRQKDFNAIKKDWMEHQPEKYLMYLLGKHNRGHLTPKEMEDFPQTVQELIQRVEAESRMQHLLAHIKNPRMQARIGRFNEETMEILKHTVLRKVPEADKEQYLARDFAKRREELRNMPDSAKAKLLSDSINQHATNLPEERTMTAKERFANMPSALNQGMER